MKVTGCGEGQAEDEMSAQGVWRMRCGGKAKRRNIS